MRQLVWMRGRATTVVDTRHIGDMALIGFPKVDAIPATLKMDLRSHAIRAPGSEHIVLFSHGGLIEACKGDAVSYGSALERR